MASTEYVPFGVAVRSAGADVVIAVRGEFDLTEVETFRACVQSVFASTDTAVTVDLRKVTFIDSTGISALLAARRQLAEQQRELRLEHTDSVSRVFELTGLTDLLDDTAEPDSLI